MRPAPIEPLPAASAPVAAPPAVTDSTPPTAGDDLASNTVNSDGSSNASSDVKSNENVTAAIPVTASADDAIMNVVHTRCSTCHAAHPTQQGFAAPPAGIIIQTPSDMKIHKDKIITAVQTGYMPLGNLTQLTDAERQQIVAYTSGL